ncbi:MAG: TAXI family TRAP transporter solute-binding subunit [Geminicoccaceae bacterium]
METSTRLLVAIMLVMTPLAATSTASAQEAEGNTYILSTATTGGAFHQGGVTLSALVKIKLLPGERIDLATRNSSGSLENITRLQNDDTDFAIVQSLLGHHARNGTGPAADLGPQRNLRAVTMLWPNVEHFIMRREQSRTGSIDDFLTLKGQRVSLGREQSAIESNRVLLANLGLDISQDLSQAFLAFQSSAAAFRRGDIDGLSLPASTPVPAFIDLLASLGPDATILSWSDEQRKQADGEFGLWSPITIPANTYRGQTEPIETIAQPNFLAVSADVDDEVVYAVTKAIFEHLPFLRRLHRPFEFLTLERAIDGLAVPLHPGAIRYFEEAGLDLRAAKVAAVNYRLFGSEFNDPQDLKQRVGRGAVKLITAEDGTSDRMTNDLVDVLGQDDGFRVVPIKGKGTAHNLADLLYLSGVDIGVLQADAIAHADAQNLYPKLADSIRFVTKWHDLEVHLLVGEGILKLEDLPGRQVNFGPAGSGSEVTASILFNQHGIAVEQTSYSHATALAKLKAGEIDGMVYVAGRPIPLFETIEVRDGLRLLPMPKSEADGPYHPATLTEADYPTLIFGSRTIDTIAVNSILATYDWPTSNPRYQPIARFVERLFTNLGELQSDHRHPKWREIDPRVEFEGWQRHPAAQTFLQRSRTAEKANGRGGPLTSETAVDDSTEEETAPAKTMPAEQQNPLEPARSHRRPVF